MAQATIRALASFCLISGAVALFIHINGGTVRLGMPAFSSAPDQVEHNTFIVTLPHPFLVALSLLGAALLFFVLSKRLQKNRKDEDDDP